jgi:hypothetical protein
MTFFHTQNPNLSVHRYFGMENMVYFWPFGVF